MSSWKVIKDNVRTDYIVIEDLQQFLVQDVPMMHPEHPIYINFWSKEIKKCIEGMWGNEFGQYRYMPGNLYYMGNYGVIEHTFQRGNVNVTEEIKPLIVDYLWDFAYMSWAAYGFSGFEKDTKVSCNILLKQYYDKELSYDSLPDTCFHNGVLKQYEDPYDYIKKLHKVKLGKCLFENPTRNVLLCGSRGGSKALVHGSKVQTPDGEINIEDIEVGDIVFGQDGKETTVLNVSPQGKRDIYKVTFNSGRTVECCKDHLWEVCSWSSKNLQIKKTEDIIKDFKRPRFDPRYNKHGWEYKYKVRTNEAVHYSTKEFELDPYLLGILLGDGHISDKYTNKLVTLTCHKNDLQTYLDNVILNEDVKYRLHQKKGTDNFTVFFGHGLKDALKRAKEKTHIYNTFEDLGLTNKYSYEKFVPAKYKLGDYNQRLRLLQGLMDTDGYVENKGTGQAVYCSTSKQLIEDLVWVARSLGISCGNIGFSENEFRGCYKVNLYTDNTDMFLLQRKKDNLKERVSNNQRSRVDWDYIKNVEYIKEDEATCISVDNKDKLFLTNDFVVTHNSYWVAIAEVEYNFIFGGTRRYNQTFINGENKAQQCVGAGDSNKSSEMLNKFLASQNAKTNGESAKFKKWFGIWTETDSKGDLVTTPCPLYRRTLGTLDCPNKKPHKIYRAKYKVEINGEWIERGSGSTIAHVNYSTKKGDGFRAAEGGRYLFSNCEEVGSMENFIEVLGANEGTISRGGNRFGVQWAQGTSGHIEYIQATKKVFLNPQDYNVLAFKNQFGHTGKNGMIGYFIPYYITLLDCKDKNGNTDYELAINKVNKQREKEASSSDPKVLRDFLMNKPCYVDEMWLTDKGYYLPYEEAASREKELTAFDRYKLLETPVKLIWDSNVSRGVKYEILHDAEPYREFPIDSSKKKDPSGCIVIYEFPQEINGYVPHDLYQFIGLDPYVEEDIDRGGSVGSLFILINPKYIPQGFSGNCIAASYIGKPTEGLSIYYENVEKLLSFYGNPIQGLAFEKNRGESCREHFIRKNKTQLLMVTPQNTMGANIYQRNIVSFGYNVGNRIAKLNLVKMLNDWLLEETTLKDGTKKNIERIPSLFLIRQIMQYNLDDNFDAVDGFRGCILALREYETKLQSETNRKEIKSNDFKSYNNNERIFKQRKDQRFSSSSSTRIRKNV